jgi:hypothetical protein
MVNQLIDIILIRKGSWLISYLRTCDCGCVKVRYAFSYVGNKPSDTKAKTLINEDFDKR